MKKPESPEQTSRFDKPYDPGEVESRWYQQWMKQGLFSADPGKTETGSFSMVIPPPNITGSLHLGHALNSSLQDILIRWKRMQGLSTLWLPGTDHAGIATQNVVERQLSSEKTTRETLGRKAFNKRVWKWREESGRTIIGQLKRLGASCDWDRERFTLDEGLSNAVREVFVRLFEDGLIYRGERLINWCPRCQTALSDIEVEHEETRGKLYHIHYPLEGNPKESLTVATTRPETLLGDTAVAVHPEDPRFKHLIGQKVDLPLTTRTIPIIGDPILVDREFGTGAVKITPGEDFNDEAAGKRHNLPKISVLTKEGKIDPFLQDKGVTKKIMGKIADLDAIEARKKIVAALDEKGCLGEVIDHRHSVGTCYRCKTRVIYHDSPQWYVAVNKPGNSLAEPALEAVRSGRIRLIPEDWKNNYYGWMENIQDWCISRQIWWGHQIPVWYCLKCSELTSTQADGTWIIPSEAKAIVQLTKPEKCKDCGGTKLIQDPDVLDTWFSSALWPFSTLGWPEKTKDLEAFYPTSTLVTSFDILFFWVARMIMMGLRFTGEVPFRNVYIHALVRDAKGQKMSKSKGNVVDPLVLMEKFGTDALRFTLASMASPGRDIKLSEERIEGYRNFANKLWNAARFIHMQCGTDPQLLDETPKVSDPDLPLSDRWILTRLGEVSAETQKSLEVFRFDEAAQGLYQFAWHEFCDWYLELSKAVLGDPDHPRRPRTLTTLVATFEALLRLLHPFMPFITEEIWQTLPWPAGKTNSISTADFLNKKEVLFYDPVSGKRMAELMEIVTRLRGIRAEMRLPPTRPLAVVIRTQDQAQTDSLSRGEQRNQLTRLGRLSDIEASTAAIRPSGSILLPSVCFKSIWVKLQGVVDPEKEKSRLGGEINKLRPQMEALEKKLANPAFREKAPETIISKDQNRIKELTEKINQIERHIETLKELG